jgi:pre-rRNA-processing protein IPI1
MGSSAKKKREKKKDFQKPKLKVGKDRPKAANHTDTKFRAKAIVLNQQLNVDAPSSISQFQHHLSLVSSKSESQRREALAFLTTYISSTSSKKDTNLPVTGAALIEKLCPCILDSNNGVRSQVVKLLHSMSAADIQDHVPRLLPHVRAGMTSMSKDVRASGLDILSVLIATVPEELVSGPGGWYSTLECFIIMLGWRSSEIKKWTMSKPAMGEPKTTARILVALSEFLEAGLAEKRMEDEGNRAAANFPYWDLDHHRIPTKSNAYDYLNLYGTIRDEKTEMLEDREDRLRVYDEHFRYQIETGVAPCRKEGGEIGRASGLLSKVLERYTTQSPP